jgi:hypothetical protein
MGSIKRTAAVGRPWITVAFRLGMLVMQSRAAENELRVVNPPISRNRISLEIADTGAGIPEHLNVLEQPITTGAPEIVP